MSRRSFPQMARYLLAALVALFALAQPAAADTALLRVSPQSIQVDGAETLVEVALDGVSGLYGLDIRLEFDPALLEIVDADDGKDGVQVSPGQIPSPDFVVRNEADNAAGGVWYAATQMNPREPASGSGVVCSFRVRGLAAGAGELRVVAAKLVDWAGVDLPVETSDAQVTVSLEAAPSLVDTPVPSATPTTQPTATATNTPAPTEEPTATDEPEEAEPTATDEPTATPEPTDEPTIAPTPEPTAIPTASATKAPPPVQSTQVAYPAPTSTPTAATDAATRPSPTVKATQTTGTLPTPSDTPEPDPTATSTPEESPQPAPEAAPPDEPEARGQSPAPEPASEAEPLISPRLFAALLGLVAAAALALAVYLTRQEGQPPHHPAERKAL